MKFFQTQNYLPSCAKYPLIRAISEKIKCYSINFRAIGFTLNITACLLIPFNNLDLNTTLYIFLIIRNTFNYSIVGKIIFHEYLLNLREPGDFLKMMSRE